MESYKIENELINFNKPKIEKIIIPSYLGYFKYNEETFSLLEKYLTEEEYLNILNILNSIISETKGEFKLKKKFKNPSKNKKLKLSCWISIFIFILFSLIGINVNSLWLMILSVISCAYSTIIIVWLYFENYFSKKKRILTFRETMIEVSKLYLTEFNEKYNNKIKFKLSVGKDPFLILLCERSCKK